MRVWIYGAVFALAALGMVPGALFLGLLALILPGIVLILAPNVALYLLLVDYGLMEKAASPTRLGKVLAFVPLILLATLPPLAMNAILTAQVAAERAGDFARPDGQSARRLLLAKVGREKSGGRWRYYGHVNETDCDETCARLLLSGQVDKIVRPKRTAHEPLDLTRGYVGPAVVYSLDKSPDCPTQDLAAVQADPRLSLMAVSQCLVGRTVARTSPDAALTLVSESRSIGALNPFNPGLASTMRWTSWRCAADRCRPLVRTTTVHKRALGLPLLIGFDGGPDLHMKREWWRVSGVANPTTDVQQLARAFKLDAQAEPRLDPVRVRAAAERALADSAASGRRLEPAEAMAIDAALQTIKAAPELVPADSRFLAALIVHPTADVSYPLSEAVLAHPAVLPDLAPRILSAYDRITAGDETLWQADQRRGLAALIARFPPDILARDQAGIFRAASRPKALYGAESLIATLGRMGPGAAPVLVVGLGEGGDEIVQSALALCRLGPDGAAAIPALVETRRSLALSGYFTRDQVRAINLALMRMDRPDLANQRLPDPSPPAKPPPPRPSDVLADVTARTSPEICVEKTLRF